MRVSYAMVFVSDMKRSIEFYRDVIGLPLRLESPGWTEFATEGATLRCIRAISAIRIWTIRSKESAGSCRPGLGVPDLDVFHQRMVEHSVPCLHEPRDMFGARLAQYVDPDGLPISVGEDRPVG